MLIDNLFEDVLLKPYFEDGLTNLKIVSGYASATMVVDHMDKLIKISGRKKSPISLELIVGMVSKNGISQNDYDGFKRIKAETNRYKFECKYVYEDQPIHSKLYIWCDESGSPRKAYIGSANYTQNAFFRGNSEVMEICNEIDALSYFNSLDQHCIYCDSTDVTDIINVSRSPKEDEIVEYAELDSLKPGGDYVGTTVKVSLVQRKDGQVPETSGLNWGQRENREKNQAYLSLNAEIYNSNFFPPRGESFNVITDDEKTLIMVRAQESAKALHTPSNNSLLGEYFRNRLGLANGQYVDRSCLEEYGRLDVEFTKIDDDTFYMNFDRYNQ